MQAGHGALRFQECLRDSGDHASGHVGASTNRQTQCTSYEWCADYEQELGRSSRGIRRRYQRPLQGALETWSTSAASATANISFATRAHTSGVDDLHIR